MTIQSSGIGPLRAMNWMRHSQIEGLVALVVGGGSGIGEASARIFAANGGYVAVADLRRGHATAVTEVIQADGGNAVALEMNVALQSDVDAAVNATIARYGRLDVVINAAAAVRPIRLEQCCVADWRAVFEVNVEGALWLARTCLPHLRKSPAAAIVNVGSLGGVYGRPNGGAYGPSKAALVALSRQMALEWVNDGVRVNVVIPGTIDTPLARVTVPAAVLAERAAKLPMGRLGEAGELADMIVFLASPAASYITAQSFTVDGGHSQSLLFDPMGQTAPENQ
jgi:NAD(P)-dependent dehydrogenase (short-subunit alcohol dehydrogenase family)